MEIKRLDGRLSVTAQPELNEFDQIAEQGFGVIISNRPQGESEDQPDSEELKQKAESLGMAWYQVPVKPGEYSQGDIDEFDRILIESSGPVLGFCRSGKRVTHLWALSQVAYRPVQELIEAAHATGYDLEPLRERLEQQASQAVRKS